MRTTCATVCTFFFVATFAVASPLLPKQQDDSLLQRKRQAEKSKVMSPLDGINLTIQNVTLSSFPEIGLVVECDGACSVLDTINPTTMHVVENGVKRPITRIKKIDVKERVSVDFLFVLDVTGTMQPYINGIRNNIQSFVGNLQKRGIDYQLGLVLYSDVVEAVYDPTDSVEKFLGWMSKVSAFGGFDEKENALQALHDASKTRLRPSANHVAILITDAGYHQTGERGSGRTRFNTPSIIEYLNDQSVRVFCIVPPSLREYPKLAAGTRGVTFDINQPFSKILDQYSDRLANLYTIYYRSDSKVRSDSINVALMDDRKRELVRQIIPIVEIGRKIIIENLLFPVASAVLPDSVEELEVLYEFMKSRPNVIVRIEGHTDNTGSPKANKALSLMRAEAVRAYMLKKGVDPKRLLAVGIGALKPIGDNTTEFGRRLNRRTEIVIVGK
ncbi:MAG: OmpA family protein [Ignavibacteria bacterium]|jgi:outer membrane protein OmpA-like peptidoglycan-associated protein